MQASQPLTSEQKLQLESRLLVLLRTLKKNDKIGPVNMLKPLTTILNKTYDEATFPDFKDLNNYYLTPKLEDDQDNIAGTLLVQRKAYIHELLTKEAASLKQQQTETQRLHRRSASLGYSLSAVLTNEQKLICWIYIEFDAVDFINALLQKDESKAHNCIFKQTISPTAKCYNSSEAASQDMSSNERYLTSLYKSCTLPLRVGIEITTTNAAQIKGHNFATLSQLNPSKITILSCFVGNINFKEKYCIETYDNKDPIYGRSTDFINKYKALMACEILYEKESNIIQRERREGCSVC